MINNLSRQENESVEEYKYRICMSKDSYAMTWGEVASLINDNTDLNVTANACQKFYSYHKDDMISSTSSNIDEDVLTDIYKLQKEKIKLRDERTQINGLIRAISREETLKEIAREVAENLVNKKILDIPSSEQIASLYKESNKDKAATLILSDWHFGLEVNVYHNTYNPEIATERIKKLLIEVISICKKEEISELTVVNLGDLISGNIHMPLRINSRYDVITQSFMVADLLDEFVTNLCNNIPKVRYCSTTDNHSRIDPNKKESLQIESFVRVVDHILRIKMELRGVPNFEFIENTLGGDIASYDVLGHKVVAVHGDKDKQATIIPNLTMFAQQHWDMILSAHMHHFSADESNETVFLCNGSLMGTDDYASSLRCNSAPSQLLIISTPKRVDNCLYKITLN